MTDQPESTGGVVHFANTERAVRLKAVMCGYAAPEDQISTDPEAVTCVDCLDWITPP